MPKSISMKNSVRGVMKAAGVLLGLLLFSTCDVFNVGLGNKVDIRPPEIAITSPANNDYRGADFTVTGTVADDLGLSSVTVVVDSVSYEASVSGGSWSVALPIAGISEGRKTISAVAKDDAGKERTAAIDVNIDYSAPTVMVTSPTTFGVLAGDVPQNTTYIDIKGSTYDPSPIDSIVVRLLDASKSEIATAVAKGTDTWSVRFVLKDDLLGAADDGHAFFYDVVATDKPGNVSEVYYHSYDIYNLVPPGVLFPAMDEIGTLDQAGTGVSPSGLDAAALIAKRLGQASVRADIQYGNFKYVNEAIPIIAFSNLDAAKPQNENLLGLNAVATGNIIPPVNSGAIDPATLSVEIFTSSAPAVPLTTITTSNANKDNLALVSLGDSLSFTVAMKNGVVDLPQGGYKMVVTAKAQGSEFNSQAVMFFIDSGAPTLNETTVGIGMPFRKAPFTLGAVALDGLYSSLGLQDLKVYQSKDGAPEALVQTIDLGGAVSSSWASDPLPSPAADGSYNYTLVLTTISGKTANAYRAVTYDSVAPVVEITNFDSYATGSKVNGTVAFNSIASDANGIEGTKYFVTTTGTAPAYSASVGSPASVLQVLAAQSIDTTSLPDLGTYYLWVVARDKAGNEAANSTPLSFQVDQSTDRPVVTLASVSSSITAEGGVDKDHNLLQAGGKLSGGVADDDGVASATLEIDLDRDGSFEGGAESVALTLSGFGKTKTFEYAASGLPENSYSFRIDAQDTNATPVHNAAMTPVWFAYDVSDPTVVFDPNATDASPVGPYRKGDFTAQGTVQDASGITKVEFSLDGGATWTDLGVTEATGAAKAWTHLVGAAANNGAKSLVARATDRYGRTSRNSGVPVVIDTAAPTASIVPFGAGHYADTTLALSGTAADPLSGLSKVEYSLASAAGPWSLLTGTASWFKNDIETQALPEGTATVWVRATDNAGNESGIYSQTFLVDHFAPTLTVDAAFDGAVYKNAQFTVNGTVADTNLGATPVGITATKDGVSHVLANAIAYDAGPDPDTWSLLVNIGGTGNYELTITATDGVGRKTVEKRSITVDTTPPLVSITSFDSYATGSKVNGTVAFNSIASDANGIEGTKYFVTTTGTAPAYSASVGSPASVLQVLAAQSIDTTSLPDLGTYYLWVVARDKAGNEAANATPLSFQVDQSTDRPVVTLASVSSSITAEGGVDKDHNLLQAGGKLSGSVADDDGVASATLEIDLDRDGSFEGGAESVALTLSGFGKTKTFEYAASGLPENSYSFRIDAQDTNATPVHNAAMTPVWFAYDVSDPTVVFDPNATDASPVGPYRKGDFTAQGTVQDASGITKVEFSLDGGATWTDLGVTEATGAAKGWTHAIGAAANNGAKSLVARATDRYGRTSRNSGVPVVIDTAAPSANILAFSSGYYADTQLAVSGSASDATSGVLKVEYSLVSNAGPWSPLAGTTSWFKNDISTSLSPEGSADVWVKATDLAGNESAVASRSFVIDHGAPVIEVEAAFDGAVYKNAAFSIGGTVSDGNLGANPIAVTAKKGGAAHALTGAFTYGAGSWSQVVNIDGSGVYEITVTATDSLNRTSSATRSVTVDLTLPTLEITSVLPILPGAEVNGKVTLSANASDANGLLGVKYFLRSDASVPAFADAASAPLGGELLDSSTPPYSAVIDTTAVGIADDTAYTLWVVARDRAGNDRKVSTTINVNQGSDTASGSIESPTAGDQIGADKKIRGVFADDDGVAANGATLYIRKIGAGSYTSLPIATASSAGQLVAWTVDASAALAAGDGGYEIYLGVTDDAARKNGLPAATYTGAAQVFTYDINPPTVSNPAAAPVKTAYKAGDAITISWTASDASGIASQIADIDGAATGLGAITNPSGDNFQVVYTVPSSGITSGNKTFSVVTSDQTGRSTTKTLIVTVDVDAPVVENAFTLNPGFVGFTPNGTFEIKGSAYDNRSVSSVDVCFSSDGVAYSGWFAATLASGNWSYGVNSATYVAGSGTLHFKARATDAAGNESAQASFSQAVDQAADMASATVINPVAGSTNGTAMQFSGTAADDDNLADLGDDGVIDADSIEIEYDTVPSTGAVTVNPAITGSGRNATWNYSVSLAGGGWTMRARVKDDNGAWGDWTSSVAFQVDTGAPALVVSTDFTGLVYTKDSNLTISGTASDSGGLKYVHARINGGAWILASAAGMVDGDADGVWDALATGTVNWSLNLNLGADGLKTIEIAASDNVDSVSSVQRSTTLDATSPAGAFDSMFRDDPSGSYLSTSALNKIVRVTGTVTELNLRDANPVEMSIDGGAYAPVTGTFVWSRVWDTSALSGAHELALRITDKAGNVTTSVTKTVTVDQAADTPQITQAFVAAPASADAGSNVLGALLKVSGTISDDDGFNSGAVAIYLDGSATPIGASSAAGTTATWDYTWGALASGEHRLSLVATDRNGATVSLGPTYFLVDNANPVLALSTPSAGAKIKAGTLSITGTATDSGGFGAAPVSLTLRHSDTGSSLHNDNYLLGLSGSDFSQDIVIDSAARDGTLFLDLVLTDRAGKQATITRAVTIDTTAPVLNLNYPSVGAYINGLVSVTGTADDLNGLADVAMEILDPANLNLVKATVNRSGSALSSWEFPLNSGSYASSTYGLDVNGDGKLWQVWFKLKATDNSGNVTELKTGAGALDYPYFFIDTDGDKPSISVTQPKNGDKIGGFVNMFGTATDDDGPVMQVEVQIDFNGDGDFADSRDLDGDLSVQLGADKTMVPSATVVRVGDPAHRWEDEAAWYEVPVTNNAWTLELNSDGELYAGNTGGTGDIAIRVRSRDQFGLASEISTRTITLDQTFPRIENVTPLDQSYQHGGFTLSAEFGDNIDLNLSNLSQIRVNINKTGYVTLPVGAGSGTGWTSVLTADLGGTQHGYDLSLALNSSTYFPNSSGILYVDLYVKDESNYTNQRSFTFYVDNQSPTAEWSTRSGAPDGLGTRNGQIAVNGTANVSFVEGNYLDSGSVSGIDRIEVYFAKAGKIQHIASDTPEEQTPASTEAALVDEYNEATGVWNDANGDGIGEGPASETVPIVAWSDPGYGDGYVIKVDRATEMSSISTGSDSDGDGYYEFMGIDGGAQRWRAYFDSSRLPDGEIDIHYVVYDLAGNRVHKVRRGFIANSGPQFDRIRIGSDYNGSGTILDVPGAVTEIQDYFVLNGLDRYAASSPIKVKNGLLYFNVQSSDPNGSNQGIASTVVSIVAPSPGTRGLLTSFGGASGGNVQNAAPIAVAVGSAQFPSAGDYTLEVVVKDNDGIMARRNLVVTVINTVDTAKPVVAPYPMSQAASIATSDNGTPDDASDDYETGHLELQSENEAGKWTSIIGNYGGDNDPKVSGTVHLKGSITDDGRISEVNLTLDGVGTNVAVASWDSGEGKLVSAPGSGFAIETQALTENGHSVTYSYAWNTAGVTGTAALDRTVAFQAKDSAAAANVSDPHGSLRYDVVPYVTGFRRSGDYNTLRSRYGRYLAHRGEALSVVGMNVFNSAADTISLGGASVALPAGSTSSLATVTVPAAAKSGEAVLIVNGIVAVNNKNDNTKAWNKEASAVPSLDGSTYWTDDRYLHVWQSDDNQAGADRGYFTGSVDPEYPAMSFDSANRLLYGSWSNYATARVLYGPNNGTSTYVFDSYDPLEHTDIHYGSRVNIAFNANTFGNTTWDVTGAGGTYVWNSQATNVNDYSGTAVNGVYNAEALYHDQKLMQFINQRVVTSGNDIHVSYYDTDTKALKYWHRTSGVNSAYAQTWINIDGGSDTHDGTDTATDVTYVSSLTPTDVLATYTGTATSTSLAPVGTHLTTGVGAQIMNQCASGVWLTYSNAVLTFVINATANLTSGSTVAARVQPDTTVQTVHRTVGDVVAAGDSLVTMANGVTVTATADGTVTSILGVGAAAIHNSTVVATVTGGSRIVAANRSASAGEFSAIDVTPTNAFPVVAYYDIANQTVKIARARAANPSVYQWSTQPVMAVGDANYKYSGKYVSMRIDSSGYLHLAFYRNSTGDLVYMKSTNHPTDGATPYTFGASVVVDSLGSVGVWADLTLNGSTPYISYLDSSLANTFDGVKMAYYDPALDTEADSEPDSANGWETMNAPLAYEVESVRTSIEYDTSSGGGFWSAAIGYSSTDYYRLAYYVKP